MKRVAASVKQVHRQRTHNVESPTSSWEGVDKMLIGILRADAVNSILCFPHHTTSDA